jgi:phosphoserine phosphatase
MIQMVVFDMDGVLVDIDSSWQVVHRAFSVDNSENLHRHQRGEITYTEFVHSDIGLWGRTHQDQIQQILATVPLMQGVKTTFTQLHRAGKITAIISSGLMPLANRLRALYNIDYVYANELRTDMRGYLTGEGDSYITLDNKGDIFTRLCTCTQIPPGNCAVIGDSRFDLPLFHLAGLSIAFNAKDSAIQHAADITITSSNLSDVLPWLLANRITRGDLSFTYPSPQQAKVIVNAISPDNRHLPIGLHISTYYHEQEVKIRVVSTKGLSTVLATLDDLLLNIQIIEKTFPVLDAV